MGGPPIEGATNRDPTAPATVAGLGEFHIKAGKIKGPERILLYGPGKVGKTSLVATMETMGRHPLFLDLDGGSKRLDVDRIEREELMTWEALIAALESPLCEGYDTIVIDSVTEADSLSLANVVRTIPAPGGGSATSVESFGYGKGFVFNYENFGRLLMTLEQYHTSKGRSVVLVAHDTVAPVPNPKGEDWLRYEPRMQNKGNSNIRARVKEWVDSVFRVDFDVAVSDGKGQGAGTRSIYTSEMPTFWAGTRNKALGKAGRISYPDGSSDLWKRLFKESK